jgi:hypothetical protein
MQNFTVGQIDTGHEGALQQLDLFGMSVQIAEPLRNLRPHAIRVFVIPDVESV